MMRGSGSKGKDVPNGTTDHAPLENGLSQTEEGEKVQKLAAKVVDNVVKLASEAADQRSRANSPAKTSKLLELKKLPTIQIDTVPSPPWSPSDSVSDDHTDQEQPLDEAHIDLQLQDEEQHKPPDGLSEEERESVRVFVEGILAEAMVVAEKKLKFVGLDDDEEDEDESNAPTDEAPQLLEECVEPVPSTSQPVQESSPEPEETGNDQEEEIRETAEKVVDEVICKAKEQAADRLEKETASFDFPGLPTFQIDTVVSAPPSPEDSEEELQQRKQTKWSFRVKQESEDIKSEDDVVVEESPRVMITFEDAPEDVKDVASSFIKEIVGKAITMAEEKAVPTVPFNFEDVDLIKTSGPWYVRVREGFLRVLRSACFCTPRRNDS